MRKRLIICYLLGLWIDDIRANEPDKNDELSKVQAGINTVTQNMQRIELQKNTLQSLLGELEKRYGETAALLKALHGQIDQKRRSLTRIRQDIQHYQQEIDKENKVLEGQVRAAYAMGRQGRLKLILNQQDPALSSRIMVYYDYFNKERLNKLAQITESVKHLDQLDQQKQAETDLLEQDLEQRKSEQLSLNEVRKKRTELLAQLRSDFSSNEQQLSQLKEDENKLRNLIGSLQPKNEEGLTVDDTQVESAVMDEASPFSKELTKHKRDFSTLKGKLPWPVSGTLIQKFGSRQLDGMRDGVLISAREGADIHAVTRGKVAYAEWLRGYGLLIIIDHGNGYMTLYAFNQSLYKHAGESVEAGEVIASVGQSGGRSEAGLYFGIRKQGTPVDPLEWCRK
jgi:septal ring factor EnvC (AmiA/AmiB activator)